MIWVLLVYQLTQGRFESHLIYSENFSSQKKCEYAARKIEEKSIDLRTDCISESTTQQK